MKARYPLKPAGLTMYTRIRKIYRVIKLLLQYHELNGTILELKHVNKLRRLEEYILKIISTHFTHYLKTKQIYNVINEIRVIFNDENLSQIASLKQFSKIKAKVREYIEDDTMGDEYRKGHEALLKTMISWEEKLFTFKLKPMLPKTNNKLESFFNETMRWQRRTSGVNKGNNSFRLFGNYLVFIDTSLNVEEIRNILDQIDYKKCFHVIQEEKRKARNRYAKIKKLRNWDEEFELFKDEVILSNSLS